MKGKARRLLSWVCVLALCMSLLPVTALAVPGSGNTSSLTPEDKYYTLDGQEASEENADITLSKQAVDKGDGTYTVTLSATAKRVVTAKPTEVVFVIDGSGSMNWCEERANKDDDAGCIDGKDHYHGYDDNGVPYCNLVEWGGKDSRWDIALEAIETMMDNLGEEGISYKFVVYKKNSYHDYAKEFDSFSDLQSIKPSGGTYLSAGVEKALDAFEMDNANQVMIIVADGDSDDEYPSNNRGEFANFKSNGGEVYTVGFTFSSERFNNLSSGDGYHFTANDADQLKLSMEQISENIKGLISDPLGDKVELVGGVKGVKVSYLDSNSTGNLWVTGDTINWTHNDGLNGTVTLTYTVKIKDSEKKAGEYSVDLNDQATLNYRYNDWSGNYYSNSVDFPEPVAAVKAATLDIQVKDGSSTSPIGGGQQWLNLDSNNAFDLKDIPDVGEPYSDGKWVESVTVTAKDGNKDIENVTIDDLNDPDPYAYTVTITLTDEEPGPVLDPQATPIKVRVMVDGEEMGAGANVGTYVTVSPDQAKQPASWDEASQGAWDPGTFHEDNDTVTYSVTYYDCKDISFKATDGYVIEAVDADLVYGQSGCQGITNNNGIVTADNVQGDSTVTVYVRTLYSVEYYLDEDPLSYEPYDDSTKYVAGTTELDTTTEEAKNPTDQEDTYFHVECGCENRDNCEHKGYTDITGGQPSTQYIKTFEQKDEITLPALPTKDNYIVDGWWLDQSCTGEPNFEAGEKVSVSSVKPESGTVIKFYSESTPDTAKYTVNYEFLDKDGNKIANTDSWTSDSSFPKGGTATIGETVNLTSDLPQKTTGEDGNNYVLVEGNYSCEITAGANEIIVTYALDNWKDSEDGDTETGGDGIPDKYQALVKFAAKENGTVSGTGTTQVFTLKDGDAYAESGTITPVNTEITITPANGYAFDIWTEGEDDSAVNPFTAIEVNGGDTITFYANFDTDEIGTKDPDKGDGIPDKYEATVTYKVVGGTWRDDSAADIQKVFDLKTYDEATGQWNPADPTPTLGDSIPTDMEPNTGYVEPGNWDATISKDTLVTENVTYTYTFPKANPELEVTKDAEETYVNVGEEIHYTVTVNNTGDVALENVKVTDSLWKDGDVISVQVGEDAAQDVTVSADSSVTIPEIPVGDSAKIIYTYTTTKTGEISNTVTVESPTLPDGPTSTTEKVSVYDPSVAIQKELTSVSRGESTITDDALQEFTAQVGDELTYQITVTNDGVGPLGKVDVTDSLWGHGVDTVYIGNSEEGTTVTAGGTVTITGLNEDTSQTITYTYTVQPGDIENGKVTNTATASIPTDPDGPEETDTEEVPMDDYTVTITPANITIYTGGEDYSGVVDENGNLIGSTETNTGLPEPGYHITLPAAVTEWLNDKEGGEGSTGEDAARDLANYMTFTYDVGETTREWGMQYQGVYSTNPETGEVRQYVYSLTAGKTEDNKEIPVRLQFKNGDQVMTSDNFDMSAAQVHQTYDMTIYSGELNQGQIKAKLTVGEEGTEQSISCDIKIGSGELTIRSVVDKTENTNAIAADENAVTNTETATAVSNGDVTYYVNDSKVEVKNEGDRVQLLVDQVSDNTDFNAAMGNDAVAKVNAALEEGNTLSNAAYDLAYMDLVDTQNGNAVVTMGDNQSLFIYWPVPENAAADSEFHVVHYTGMDREGTVDIDKLEEQQADVKTGAGAVEKVTIGDQEYVKFTTSSFSPFALVYEKAPDPVAKLEVTKTLTKVNGQPYTGGSVSVNDTLTYTITVKNGEVALNNVTITDTFNGKGDLNFTLPNGATVSENPAGTYTINLGNLTAGQEVTITATYKVLRGDANGTLTNAVSVTGTPTDGGEPTTGGDTETTPVNPYHPPIRPPEDPDKPELNTEDHYAYIVGYEDGSVQPEGDITRAEVATIFFRLLTDESRNEYWSQTNPYSDVSADDWFNNAVSTLTNAGVLDGYEDGTFKPNGNITRAEFATITARFFEATYDGENLFPDIEGHWAQDYINEAANAGIVNGYEDGTFRPQQYITRAEAVTMVNRTIERHPDADHLLDDMITWPDNPETAWYYEQIQEATNSHEYTMNTDDEQNPYEIWTKLLPNRDWSELEKEWSDANDGAGSGEVV